MIRYSGDDNGCEMNVASDKNRYNAANQSVNSMQDAMISVIVFCIYRVKNVRITVPTVTGW